MRWTGPLEDDLSPDGYTLRRMVSADRWPYGPPEDHSEACNLNMGGLYCDCAASAADDEEDQ